MGIFASKRTTNKANIVLVHGFWADGSGWSKVIPTLQAQGHFVIAEQNGLTSLANDVTTTRQILAELEGPTLLVGHSYGGFAISEVATDAPGVVGLVSRIVRLRCRHTAGISRCENQSHPPGNGHHADRSPYACDDRHDGHDHVGSLAEPLRAWTGGQWSTSHRGVAWRALCSSLAAHAGSNRHRAHDRSWRTTDLYRRNLSPSPARQ